MIKPKNGPITVPLGAEDDRTIVDFSLALKSTPVDRLRNASHTPVSKPLRSRKRVSSESSAAVVPLTVEIAGSRQLYEMRHDLGLTVSQMADAIGVSPATLEAWESGRRSFKTSISDFESAFSQYEAKEKDFNSHRNVLFGQLTLKSARATLNFSCKEIATQFGYSEHTWRSFEQGRRGIPPELVKKVEDMLLDKLGCLGSR